MRSESWTLNLNDGSRVVIDKNFGVVKNGTPLAPMHTIWQLLEELNKLYDEAGNKLVYFTDWDSDFHFYTISIFVFDEVGKIWKAFTQVMCDAYGNIDFLQKNIIPLSQQLRKDIPSSDVSKALQPLQHVSYQFFDPTPNTSKIDAQLELRLIEFFKKLWKDEIPFYHGKSGNDLLGNRGEITVAFAGFYYDSSDKLNAAIDRYIGGFATSNDLRLIADHWLFVDAGEFSEEESLGRVLTYYSLNMYARRIHLHRADPLLRKTELPDAVLIRFNLMDSDLPPGGNEPSGKKENPRGNRRGDDGTVHLR